MRARARISTTAAVFALSALALTACGGNDDSKADGDKTSASASASTGSSSGNSAGSASKTKGTGTGGGASTGDKDTSSGTGGDNGGDGGATSACSTKNTEVAFVQSGEHAGEQAPATGYIQVTNTSNAPCTIVGATTLTAKDDQGKAAPIETDNAGNGTDAVDVKAGGTAKAYVAYTDVNFEGSASGREVCAVQASKVEIALPDDVARTVNVTKDGGAAGSFNVCTTDVRVGAFETA
ncbi:DUF4232 domain-containing protein [Streptomyces sp. NBC_01092]|uniref:DUF4232 domain-containing protein n=1 Tax=Streptomyces sp. NBC_01092 TaxID=2903748 RepID=UPI00386ECDD7|nr:DUF4232 domain-containing protein [Streptomyces sp. NBC_01092]